MVDKDRERVARVLRDLVEHQVLPMAEIERRLRWARGTISRLVQGKSELRVTQLIAILEVIGVSPVQFFERVCPPKPPRDPAERALGHLSGIGAVHEPLVLPRTLSESDLRQLIEEAVSTALSTTREHKD